MILIKIWKYCTSISIIIISCFSPNTWFLTKHFSRSGQAFGKVLTWGGDHYLNSIPYQQFCLKSTVELSRTPEVKSLMRQIIINSRSWRQNQITKSWGSDNSSQDFLNFDLKCLKHLFIAFIHPLLTLFRKLDQSLRDALSNIMCLGNITKKLWCLY